MWTESPPALTTSSTYPADLGFLSTLDRRFVAFTGEAEGVVVGAGSDDVIVPEPASLSLLAAALLGSVGLLACLRRRR